MKSSIFLPLFFFTMGARASGRTRGLMLVVVLSLLKQTTGGFAGSPLVTKTYLSTGTEDSEQSTDFPSSTREVISDGTVSSGYFSTSEISDLHPSSSQRKSDTGKNDRFTSELEIYSINTGGTIKECVMCGPRFGEFSWEVT